MPITDQGPLVSVIIPVYNGAQFISKTLASVQDQTYSRWEAIVVDDGSIDDSVAQIRQMAARDDRITVVCQSNGGTQAARNTGLSQARGDFVALLDQDDLWLPGKLDAQIRVWRENPRANLFFTNYWNWDGATDLSLRYSQRRKFPEGDESKKLIRWCLFGASTVMVRREVLDKVGCFNVGLLLTGDWDLWLRIAETGLWAGGVWEPQVRYRLWPGNASKNVIRTMEENVRVLEQALTRPQLSWRRRAYRRSLAIARGNLELAQIKPLLDGPAEKATAGILRAWKCCPRQIKWLFWYWATLCPNSLGGRWTSRRVYDKIRGKW